MAGHPDYNRLLTMTIEKIIPRVEDQIFGSKPFLFALTNFGNVETLDGGTTIEQPLMYAELRNQGSYSGADTFLTEEDEGHTRAVFEWKQYYAMLVLKNIDLAKNSGPSAVLRIVDQELRRAELSISEELDRIFLSDGTGNGGKDFTGIKKIVSDTIPYGGIDPTVGGNEWWRSKVTTSFGDLEDFTAYRNLYLDTSEGNDFITNFFTTQDIYAKTDELFEDRQRFEDPTMADQGFITISYHGVPITFDRNIDEGTLYGLNMKYLHLYKLGNTWFRQSDWKEPINQDIRMKKILLYGELACSNRKRQGVTTGITIPAA